MQSPSPKAAKFSHSWYSRPGYVYFIAAGSPPIAIKIGVTQQTSMHKRLKAIQSSNHEVIELLGVISFHSGDKPLLDCVHAERALHQRFSASQRLADWTVGYEWFTATPEMLAYIVNNSLPPEQLGLPRTIASPMVIAANT
jgi:hypothetical protein